MLQRCLFMLLLVPGMVQAQFKKAFNDGWEFIKDVDTAFSPALLVKTGSPAWEKVSLPHTAHLEPVEKKAQQWQGICFYRKFFFVPADAKSRQAGVQFDAAMQEADVYINGKPVFNHKGGYLPFYIDLSPFINWGAENNIVVRLDNRDNPSIPPGKPLKDLDFNYYSGLYRNAWFITKYKVYISNPIAANRTAAGGIITYSKKINDQSVALWVQTDLQNDGAQQAVQVRLLLTDKAGKVVAQTTSGNELIEQGRNKVVSQSLTISNPQLWSPDAPYLYQLSVAVLRNGKIIDEELVKTGLRTVRFEAGAFFINDKKLAIRGTNRHQEYPWIGNALPDNAQYRDAWKIKAAGFNFVRTSHYPPSPAFLDACDELGILVMDAIPGWQFFGNDVFRELSFQTVRDMVRRDRNHPSIILWEASLNESRMSKEYMQQTHAIVHEELPFTPVYTAGWLDNAYDVFIPARQHGKAPDYWKKYDKQKPLLIAEYGDWEYYAGNAGFNQKEYQNLKKEEKSSRQLRGMGQKRLMQQALNYQESHNDNLYGPAVGDANWLMFDYKRGYASDIEASGIMDIVRLPKFAFYFYQSQYGPFLNNNALLGKPMVFIANYWQQAADTVVTIYSNCEAVELFVNGVSAGKQAPDKDQYSTNLKQAPFTFHLPVFKPGALEAKGYLNGKVAAQYTQRTAGTPAALRLRIDTSGKKLQAGQNDVVFIYAEVIDDKGTIVCDAKNEVTFVVKGDAAVIGLPLVAAEAGIAAVLIKAGNKPGDIVITAQAAGVTNGELKLRTE